MRGAPGACPAQTHHGLAPAPARSHRGLFLSLLSATVGRSVLPWPPLPQHWHQKAATSTQGSSLLPWSPGSLCPGLDCAPHHWPGQWSVLCWDLLFILRIGAFRGQSPCLFVFGVQVGALEKAPALWPWLRSLLFPPWSAPIAALAGRLTGPLCEKGAQEGTWVGQERPLPPRDAAFPGRGSGVPRRGLPSWCAAWAGAGWVLSGRGDSWGCPCWAGGPPPWTGYPHSPGSAASRGRTRELGEVACKAGPGALSRQRSRCRGAGRQVGTVAPTLRAHWCCWCCWRHRSRLSPVPRA